MDVHPLPTRTPDPALTDVERDRIAQLTAGSDRRVRLLVPFVGDTSTVRRIAVREALYRRSLLLSDLLCATFASLLSLTLTTGPTQAYQPTALLLVPIFVLAAKLFGLYDRDEVLIRKTTADEIPSVLQLATAFVLIMWLGSGMFLDSDPSREQVLTLWALLLAAMVVGRWLVRMILARTMSPERCLVVGGPAIAKQFSTKLQDNNVNATVVGHLAVDEIAPSLMRFGPRDVDRIVTTLRDLHVDRVLVAPHDGRPELTVDVIKAVKSEGVRVSVLPHTLEVIGSAVTYDDVFGMPVLGVRRFGLTRSSLVLKRGTDILVSGLLLLAAAPLMAGIAILVKLGSRGPVFFGQERMGRDGHTFRMLKFRTMVEHADLMKDELRDRNETSGLFKIADDPRITRIGRPLRATSFDELPQLLNVLKGDMSMVGPRPLVPDEDAQIQGFDRRRLILPPGLTGPWQILGSARVPLDEMVKIDYLYAANWSAWSDIKVLLRTVVYVLRRGGM